MSACAIVLGMGTFMWIVLVLVPVAFVSLNWWMSKSVSRYRQVIFESGLFGFFVGGLWMWAFIGALVGD